MLFAPAIGKQWLKNSAVRSDQNSACYILSYLCIVCFMDERYLQRDGPGTRQLENGLETFLIRSHFLCSDFTKHEKMGPPSIQIYTACLTLIVKGEAC